MYIPTAFPSQRRSIYRQHNIAPPLPRNRKMLLGGHSPKGPETLHFVLGSADRKPGASRITTDGFAPSNHRQHRAKQALPAPTHAVSATARAGLRAAPTRRPRGVCRVAATSHITKVQRLMVDAMHPRHGLPPGISGRGKLRRGPPFVARHKAQPRGAKDAISVEQNGHHQAVACHQILRLGVSTRLGRGIDAVTQSAGRRALAQPIAVMRGVLRAVCGLRPNKHFFASARI